MKTPISGPKVKPPTPAALKRFIEDTPSGTYFFSRKTMAFFGDTMRNYGVKAKPVVVQTKDGEILAWELYRKNPVKDARKGSTFFSITTYDRVFHLEGAE